MPATASPGRIPALDAARGAAIAAMISYHFMWDLHFVGFWDINAASDPALRLYAKAIAASFLTIVGVSLYLAHRHGIRWRSFARRLAVVAAAAMLVTAGSWFAFPDSFIFFGILHCIAVASVVALPFLRAPPWAMLAAAAASFALPLVIASPALATLSTWWLGLGAYPPHSNDYVPLFPWGGFVLAGMAAARLGAASDATDPETAWLEAARRWRPRGWLGRALVFAGRHSLVIYLTHQIVLLGVLVGLANFLTPP